MLFNIIIEVRVNFHVAVYLGSSHNDCLYLGPENQNQLQQLVHSCNVLKVSWYVDQFMSASVCDNVINLHNVVSRLQWEGPC